MLGVSPYPEDGAVEHCEVLFSGKRLETEARRLVQAQWGFNEAIFKTTVAGATFGGLFWTL